MTKEDIYDRICAMLTNYEQDGDTLEDLYVNLAELANDIERSGIK